MDVLALSESDVSDGHERIDPYITERQTGLRETELKAAVLHNIDERHVVGDIADDLATRVGDDQLERDERAAHPDDEARGRTGCDRLSVQRLVLFVARRNAREEDIECNLAEIAWELAPKILVIGM